MVIEKKYYDIAQRELEEMQREINEEKAQMSEEEILEDKKWHDGNRINLYFDCCRFKRKCSCHYG